MGYRLTTNLKDDSPVLGAWIGEEGGKEDVHIDVEQGSFVIGHNVDYAHMTFTPSALCLNRDGTASYQYKDKNGACQRKELPIAYVRGLLLGLLMQVDNVAQGI